MRGSVCYNGAELEFQSVELEFQSAELEWNSNWARAGAAVEFLLEHKAEVEFQLECRVGLGTPMWSEDLAQCPFGILYCNSMEAQGWSGGRKWNSNT